MALILNLCHFDSRIRQNLAVQEEKKEETRRLQEEIASQRRIHIALEDYKVSTEIASVAFLVWCQLATRGVISQAERLPLLASLLQVHNILRPVGAIQTHFMASDLPESLQDLSRDDVVFFDSLHANLVAGDIEDVLTNIGRLDGSSSSS